MLVGQRRTEDPDVRPLKRNILWRAGDRIAGTIADSLDPERREEFHRTWLSFFEERYRDGDAIRHPRHYLLTIGSRR